MRHTGPSIVAHGLSGSGTRTPEQSRCAGSVPRPGIEPTSLALQAGFLTTGSPGRSLNQGVFGSSGHCNPVLMAKTRDSSEARSMNSRCQQGGRPLSDLPHLTWFPVPAAIPWCSLACGFFATVSASLSTRPSSSVSGACETPSSPLF